MTAFPEPTTTRFMAVEVSAKAGRLPVRLPFTVPIPETAESAVNHTGKLNVVLEPVASTSHTAVPLPLAIGTSAACADPNVSPAGTGTKSPASAAVSRAVAPEPADVFVSPTQTCTPRGILLNAALNRVPESARPAVPPETGSVNSVSEVTAAPGTPCNAGGGELSGPENAAVVRVRNARLNAGANRSVTARLFLPRLPDGMAKSVGSTENVSPGATCATTTD